MVVPCVQTSVTRRRFGSSGGLDRSSAVPVAWYIQVSPGAITASPSLLSMICVTAPITLSATVMSLSGIDTTPTLVTA